MSDPPGLPKPPLPPAGGLPLKSELPKPPMPPLGAPKLPLPTGGNDGDSVETPPLPPSPGESTKPSDAEKELLENLLRKTADKAVKAQKAAADDSKSAMTDSPPLPGPPSVPPLPKSLADSGEPPALPKPPGPPDLPVPSGVGAPPDLPKPPEMPTPSGIDSPKPPLPTLPDFPAGGTPPLPEPPAPDAIAEEARKQTLDQEKQAE